MKIITTQYNNIKTKISNNYAEKENCINDNILDYTTNKIILYDYVKYFGF